MPDWQYFAFRPDDTELVELTEAHGRAKALRLLDRPAQQAFRLSTVEASIRDDEQLADWHRRPR